MDKKNSENVTHRKPSRKTTSDSFSELQSASLDTTSSSIRGMSLQDLSTHLPSDETQILMKELEDHKTQLKSAYNEIENLIGENKKLKNRIQEQDKKIELLKNLCSDTITSPRVQNKSILRKKSIEPKRLQMSPSTIMECTPRHQRPRTSVRTPTETDTTKGQLQDTCKTNRSKDTSEKLTHAKSITVDSKPKHMEIKIPARKNIYIFGGHQCCGLSEALMNKRNSMKTQMNKYKFTSHIQPGAPSDEITKNLVKSNIEPTDKILLSLGEHDHNPHKVYTELSTVLKSFQNNTIFVLNVNHNKYINEKKLNTTIQLLCKNFSNCKYIETDYKTGHLKHDICNSVNKIIDQSDYDSKYLSYNKIKTILNVKDITRNYRPGTMPYYFKIINRKPEYKQPKQNLNIKTNHEAEAVRKGTIPFYFAPKRRENTGDQTDVDEFFRSKLY